MSHSLIQRDFTSAVYQRSGPTDRHCSAERSSPGTPVERRRIHKATNASYFQRLSNNAGNPIRNSIPVCLSPKTHRRSP
jgi:hypothetical protein